MSMLNGLGCKINMSSYKIKYVSGTSDLMYRKNSSANTAKVGDSIRNVVCVCELIDMEGA